MTPKRYDSPMPSAEPSAESTSRHFFREHVGELELVVEAGSLAALFAEAARALAAVMGGGRVLAPNEAAPFVQPERVEIHATDRDALLAEWLNELVFLSETRKAVYPDAAIDAIGAHELIATVRGIRIEEVKTAVKGASLHGLRIEDSAGGCRATVVLDV